MAGPEEAKNRAGQTGLQPDSDPFGDASLKKIPLSCQTYSPQLRANPPCAFMGGSGTRKTSIVC